MKMHKPALSLSVHESLGEYCMYFVDVTAAIWYMITTLLTNTLNQHSLGIYIKPNNVMSILSLREDKMKVKTVNR